MNALEIQGLTDLIAEVKRLTARVAYLENRLGFPRGVSMTKVECPRCKSEPGTFCRSPSGRKTYWHKARLIAASRLEKGLEGATVPWWELVEEAS